MLRSFGPKMMVVIEVRFGDRDQPITTKTYGLGRPSTRDTATNTAKKKILAFKSAHPDVHIMGALIQERAGSRWVAVANVCLY